MNQTPQEHPPETTAQASKAEGVTHWVRADLKAYLDGELSGLRRWLTARHIAGCASCQVELRGLEQLSRQVRTLDQAAPDARLRARILASLPTPPSAAPTAPRLQITPAYSYRLTSRRPLNALAGLCALLIMAGAFALTRLARTGAATHVSDAAPNDFAITMPVSGRVERRLAYVAARTPARVAPHSNYNNASHSDDGTSDTGNSFPSEQNVSPAYTDPTSAEADRLAATLISDKLREKRQLAAANAAPASAGKLAQPAEAIAAPAAAQVVMAVVDVSEARRQVKKWAEEAGAQMTVLAYTAADSKPFDTRNGNATSAASHGTDPARAETNGADAILSAPATPAQTPALLRLKVPAQRADSLRNCLERVGTPIAVTPSGPGRKLQMVRSLGTDDLVPHSNALVVLPAFTPRVTATGERLRPPLPSSCACNRAARFRADREMRKRGCCLSQTVICIMRKIGEKDLVIERVRNHGSSFQSHPPQPSHPIHSRRGQHLLRDRDGGTLLQCGRDGLLRAVPPGQYVHHVAHFRASHHRQHLFRRLHVRSVDAQEDVALL